MPAEYHTVTTEPGRDAAGPPAGGTRIILNLFRRYWRGVQEQCQRRRVRVALRDLSERELADIGITSAEIGHITAQRDLDKLRDGTKYPWMQ